MSTSKPIYVTQPDLPPLDDLIPMLEQIWDSRILTNGGPFHQQLEDALCEYLGVPYISLFANGTIALVTAIRALGITGEVITTPYSFVATAHALLWNDLTPVFVDIEPTTLNLDPAKIEAAITPQTTAILPVHCYGNPCDVEAIEDIADRHSLQVVYDAAHAFGVKCHCGSILNHGDLSVLSFHATKVFNTLEGGAIVCQDADTKRYIDQLKNFGFTSETTVVETGINGKMNEFNAAVGLLQLQHVDPAIEHRETIDVAYRQGLKDIPGIRCHSPSEPTRSNYSYFPIFVEDDYPLTRDQLYDKLKANGINGRRYFYPLITEFTMYWDLEDSVPADLSVAKDVAERVICLPIYSELSIDKVKSIVKQIVSI
ncbi:DegT/DnrJ/EryC1/StrS family aminotransferase [Spiribacter roseus]|uniref:DegT/DnrJ/EryC1/StrS family aminotransferase n=1 Tax=Spiribacter roseus TaxID=1855875 RepID=UPI00132F6328|nr:DegT/DnrJ/EryC1/StrS family aminotransferase [Spiribacter roseus]KAF0283211.1 aminotransferase [Spiribacter roseus]